MIPTCISEDVEAAKAVNRKTLTSYAMLPNYRNYWKEAGYVEEMEAIEKAILAKEFDRILIFNGYLVTGYNAFWEPNFG